VSLGASKHRLPSVRHRRSSRPFGNRSRRGRIRVRTAGRVYTRRLCRRGDLDAAPAGDSVLSTQSKHCAALRRPHNRGDDRRRSIKNDDDEHWLIGDAGWALGMHNFSTLCVQAANVLSQSRLDATTIHFVSRMLKVVSAHRYVLRANLMGILLLILSDSVSAGGSSSFPGVGPGRQAVAGNTHRRRWRAQNVC